MAGGEVSGEGSFFGEVEKLLSGEAAALAIDLEVAVFLELKSEALLAEEGIDLKDYGSFLGGGFEGGKEVMGEILCGGFLIEGELSGEGTGVSRTAFEDHFPDGVKAHFAPPGKAPHVSFGNAFFCEATVEIEVDDIESALRKDKEAVVGAAPGGCVHAGARSVSTN